MYELPPPVGVGDALVQMPRSTSAGLHPLGVAPVEPFSLLVLVGVALVGPDESVSPSLVEDEVIVSVAVGAAVVIVCVRVSTIVDGSPASLEEGERVTSAVVVRRSVNVVGEGVSVYVSQAGNRVTVVVKSVSRERAEYELLAIAQRA